MDTNKLRADFRRQLNEAIDRCAESDPKCAFASGMLLVLSALKMKDGPTIPMQIVIMHAALREVGEERGWVVAKAVP